MFLLHTEPAVLDTCHTHTVSVVCHVDVWGSLIQDLDLPSLVCDIVWTLKRTFKDRFDPKIGNE